MRAHVASTRLVPIYHLIAGYTHSKAWGEDANQPVASENLTSLGIPAIRERPPCVQLVDS